MRARDPGGRIDVVKVHFERFCVVGIGGHARTKLIPALQANGQRVAAVVTSRPSNDLPGVQSFRRLEEAVDGLPPDVAFLVATPPALHFPQARLILGRGFDLFLEKPAFVVRREAEEAASLCEAKSAVLVEGLMHRYTELYSKLREFWSKSRASMRRIEIRFLIDEMPAGTFRSERQLASSALFDFGCYPLSLLQDIGLGEAALRIEEAAFADDPDRTRLHIVGAAGDIAIDIHIGVGDSYVNSVCCATMDGETMCFAPFFYGRPAERTISVHANGTVQTKKFHDGNAFEAMLSRPRDDWRADQARRNRDMVEVTGRLEALARSL